VERCRDGRTRIDLGGGRVHGHGPQQQMVAMDDGLQQKASERMPRTVRIRHARLGGGGEGGGVVSRQPAESL
jgi:hypothetical protein